MERRGSDVMLLTDTEIQLEDYSHNRLGYNVTCLTARLSGARGAQVGVKLVTKEHPIGWGIESTCYHGPNMVSCNKVIGLTQNPIVGAYLSPLTLEHLLDIEKALKCFNNPIAFGDLNVDLNKERISWNQRISDLLTEYGLIDLVQHFRQRRRFRDLMTWSQVRQGTVLQLRCD